MFKQSLVSSVCLIVFAKQKLFKSSKCFYHFFQLMSAFIQLVSVFRNKWKQKTIWWSELMMELVPYQPPKKHKKELMATYRQLYPHEHKIVKYEYYYIFWENSSFIGIILFMYRKYNNINTIMYWYLSIFYNGLSINNIGFGHLRSPLN